MSVNSYQTQANRDTYLFLLANVSTLNAQNISSLTANIGLANITTIKNNELDTEFLSSFSINTDTLSSQNLEANFAFISEATVLGGFISSLITNNVVLDGNSIDTGGAGAGATLLLNGFPIVTGGLSSFSTLADWAYFPAASTLQMSMNSISNAGNIQCMNINSQNIYNALTVQTDTLSALTNLTSPAATVTNLRATNFSTTNTNTSNLFVASNATAAQVNTLALSTGTVRASSISTSQLNAVSATIRNLSTLNISTGTINGAPIISGANWSQYPATQTVQMNQNTLAGGSNFGITASNLTITASNNFSNICDQYYLVADNGPLISAVSRINLTAQNGTYGSIDITANGGFNNTINGVVNITANGSQVGGVGQGGSINLTANTPLGFSNLTSKIALNAAGINSYAGSVPSFASLYGYNYLYGQNGVSICAGIPPGALPNTVGTTYIYGTTGIEMPSDAYMKNIYPYWDGITTPPDLMIEGRYIIPNLAQVCVRMSNVKQIDFQSNVTTYMSNCDNIAMSANGTISTSNLTATNATITTLSNTSIVGSGAGTINGYTTIGATNLNTSNINNIPIAQYLNQQINTFSTASISSATISSINNFFSFGTKSARIQGDVAQLQLSNNNPAGAGTILNLLSRVGTSEIQSYNSNFTTPLPLFLNASYTSTTSMLVSTINGQSLPYPYGSFTVNASQIIGTPNTAVSSIFDRTEYANGISIVGTSSPLIAVSTSGLYRWIASPQFDTTSGGSQNVSFWFQKNGSNIPRSASRATVANNAELFSAVEIYEQMNAQDTLSFCFTSSDTNMSLSYYPASGVVPDNPALILNGNKIADI